MKNKYYLRAAILPMFLWLLAIITVQTSSAQTATGPAGGNQPFSTVQPSLALNYIIAMNGYFPPREGSTFDQDIPYMGEIFLFAGNFAPAGYRFADGALLQIAQNTALFSLLGTTYGGNGQTTFALPDLRGRIPVGVGQGPGLSPVNLGEAGGSETVTLTSAQMSSHSHTLSGGGATEATGGNQSFNNMQPWLGMNFVMAVNGIFPIFSEIRLFAGNFSPGGYFANGSLLSIAENEALFALLGTTYGGNGQTTFALPDLRGRGPAGAGNGPGLSPVVIGQQAGTPSVMMTINHLPGHAHTLSGGGNTNTAGSGNPIENRQPYLAIRYIICTSGLFPSQSGGGAAIPLIGQVRPYAAGYGLPSGWAEADGSLLQISSNQALFSLLGTTYGGDGVTTFALPDMRGRVPVGAGNGPGLSPAPLGQRWGGETVTLTSLNLPSHTHTVYQLDGGEIAADQTICYGAVPSPFTSISPATGFVGDLEYQWQISTASPTFDNIPGAESETYTHTGTVTQTTWFRRLAKGTSESTWVESNVLEVTINPARLYVTESGAGLMNGSSWTNAFSGSQLQTAINLACSEVWVAAGTYKPTSGTDRNISFSMKNGVAIYGGFAGTETILSQRNWVSNVTILSGDIGIPFDNSDNSNNVVANVNNGLTNSSIMDGFTITGGNCNPFGGGMYNHGPISPLIKNCIFTKNTGSYGTGGMCNLGSSPTVINCIFRENTTSFLGGALLNIFGATTHAINCTFYGNSCPNGGVIYNQDATPVALTNCVIWGNTGAFYGSATVDHSIVQGGYGGTGNLNADPLFVNAGGGDLRFQPCSPAINAGSNASVPSGITTDLDGNPRFYNSGTVDMGAYEYQADKPTNPTDGGEIAAGQSICIGSSPAPFTSVSLPTGYTGTLEYQWEKSTTSATAGFGIINGANSTTFTETGTLTQTTWYRRLAKVTCESTWVESNVLEVTVIEIEDQTVTANPGSICFNSSGEVIVGGSQAGTNYYLRNSSDNSIVSGPVAGTGNALTFGTGTLTNTTTFNVLAEKPVSSALEMDGTDDYISFQQDLNSVTNFTYEAWIYQKGNNSWQRIFDFGNAAGYNIFFTSSIGTSGVPRFVINIGSGEQQVTAPSALPLNTWTHIAVTLNGSQAMMYINGTPVAQNNAFSYTPASLGTTFNNWIGRSQYADGYFNGKIDEVRIWNVTRTQAQIQESMNRCLVGNESGLLAYYNFAEGTGNSFAGDVAGNGRTGTLVNMNPATVWVGGLIACTECEQQLSNEVTVTVDPLPTASAGGSASICEDGSHQVIGASAANGTILWTHNGAGSLSDETTLTPTYSADPGDAGNTVMMTMTVTSNNACGTATATATYSITVDPLPTASAGGSASICEDGSHQVSGASAANGTILWTHNGAGSLSDETTLTPTYTAASGDGGNTVTLTMTVTSNNACGTATATATFSLSVEAIAVSGTIQKTPDLAAVCEGEDVMGSLVPGTGGNGSDLLESRVRTGSNWSGWTTYSSGSAISTTGIDEVEIRTLRESASCNNLETIVESPIAGLPLEIPATTSGLHANVVTGVVGYSDASPPPGSDINIWSSTNLNFFVFSAQLPTHGYVRGMGNSTAQVDNLPIGTLVDGTQSFGNGVIESSGSTAVKLNSSENYIGFRFFNENTNQVHYGYMQLSVDNVITTRSLLGVWYENQPNTGIKIGDKQNTSYTVAGWQIDPLPSASAGGSATICENGSHQVSGALAENGTILWSHNGSGSLIGETTLTPTYTADPGDAGNTVILTMTVTSNNTCGTATAIATYSIMVDPLPTASAGGSQTICASSTAMVSGASSSNGTILWTHNGAGTLTNSTTLTPTYHPVSADGGNTITLTLTVTSNNACTQQTAQASYTVYVESVTLAGNIGGSSNITYGSSTGNLTLTGNVGLVKKWQKRPGTSGGWTDISNTTTTYSETPASSGTWQYRAQVQSGTCSELFTNPHNVVVGTKELTIGGSFTANDKIYDDNTNATFDANNLELSGIVGTEDVSLIGVEIDFASKTVGEHTVTITAASLDGADKDNYTLTLAGSPETTATINAGPPVRFLVTNPEGGDITSPKLHNIPFDVKVTLVDAFDNPTPNTGGNVTVTLTGSGGATPGDLRFQGFPADPVTQTLNAGDTISNFDNVLYTGVSAVAGFDVKVSATAAGTGTGNGKTGESNLFSVRDIFFNVMASPASIIANGSSTSNLTVTLEDHDNNPLANQTITVETDNGTLLDGLTEIVGTGTFITDGNGQVLLNLRSETTVGTATVTAKCPGACPATATVEFVPGPAAKLVFTTQPSPTTQAGSAFAQQPEITIQDAFGNTVTAATDNVTVDLTTGTGTLSGTKTVSAISGVATFTNLSIDLTGNDKVLTASSGALTAATTSPAFAITSAVASSFAVTGQNSLPAGTQSGNFTITVYDAYNNPTNVSQTTVLTLSTTSTGSGVLFTPIQVTVPANSSTATFKYSDNQLTFPGQYATLTAAFNSGDPALTGKLATKQLEVTAGLWQIANTSPAAAGNTQFYPGANWQQDVFQPSATGQSTTTNDVMHYVYQPLTGNGTIIARLDDVQNNGWAGVMMRESNAPGAKTILFKTRLYNPNVYVGYRTTTGKSMTNISKVYQLIRWMKIQRNGNTFQVFVSNNGNSWTRCHTATLSMSNTINAGIFTESSSASRTSKAWFDNVELSNTLKSGDEFSEMEIVNLDTTQVDVQIYPNPAKDFVNLNLTGFQNLSGMEATLISAAGKIMKTFILSELQPQLNIQGMKPGVYILRVENADNLVVKRLVIQ